MAYTKKEHVVIIGWSKKAETAIREILGTNDYIDVVIVDTLEKSPTDVAEERIHYIQGSLTEEYTYAQANVEQAKAVIIFADDSIQDITLRDAKTLSIALTVERIAPEVHTTAEVMVQHH
ncbi:ion transporter, partial [Bacillaceae bacterium SIJ1]|uniref:NAD-binding protein n=1 Tax=Litoribacterium kuwaitense TaxID=1398745 RepID=UPI001BADAD84